MPFLSALEVVYDDVLYRSTFTLGWVQARFRVSRVRDRTIRLDSVHMTNHQQVTILSKTAKAVVPLSHELHEFIVSCNNATICIVITHVRLQFVIKASAAGRADRR